jgi:hypothetical protein
VKDLISTGTRGLFRNLMTDSTVNTISSAFHDEGFAANPDCTYEDSSVRRVTAQEHLESVTWTDPVHVDRACRVFEQLLIGWLDSPYLDRFYASLRRDGATVDHPGTGLITPPADRGALRPLPSLATLTDPSAIQEQLDRIQRAIIDDPALAIGSAKELSRAPRRSCSSNGGARSMRKTIYPLWRGPPRKRSVCARPRPPRAPTAAKRSRRSSAPSAPSPPASASSATAATAPDTAQQPPGLGSAPDTPTSPSTPPSPGANSCSTPSLTQTLPGTRNLRPT